MAKIKKKKLGIWYKFVKASYQKIDKNKMDYLFFKNLFKIGYRYFDVKNRKKDDVFLIRAFQRRFLPKRVTGIIDQKTYIVSCLLANKLKN